MAPPPPKRRRIEKDRPEEITFDSTAREDYLTGFRKRKQQRIKHAQTVAAEKERALKIESRKHIREQRQKNLEEHVKAVNNMLNSTEKGDSSDGDGSNLERNEAPVAVEQHVEEEPERREDEYIDEEKYTTVTVEPMEESQGGEESDASDEAEGKDGAEASKAGNDERDAKDTVVPKKRIWTKKPQHGKPRKRRKKFRYETKIERKAGRSKQKAKNTAAAKARREYAPSKR